jgi:hypothetical protein
MKRVFLSYAYEDVQQVRGLKLLLANPNFDLDFYDESLGVAVDSQDADYIRSVIGDKIKRASVTVCLIGKETHKSTWVNWELEKSVKEGNKIIAMALKGIDNAVLPALIREKGLTFYSWDPAGLGNLIGQ